MDLSDLATFSVQFASIMNKSDTTAYVPHTGSPTSTSPTHISDLLDTLSQQTSSSVSGGIEDDNDSTGNVDAGNSREMNSIHKRANIGAEDNDARKRKRMDKRELFGQRARLDSKGNSNSDNDGDADDGPVAGKRPRRMHIGSAYINQFLIENGVKLADLEQSRAKSVYAIGHAVVLSPSEMGIEARSDMAVKGSVQSVAFAPKEDISTFLDMQHRMVLNHTLASVDTTMQLLSDEIEALRITERAIPEKYDQDIELSSTPIIDIKECLENEYDRKKKKLIMKRISDIDEEKLDIKDRFADKNVAEHISHYYNALKSYVGGEPLAETFAAAIRTVPAALPYQKQSVPEKDRVVAVWDFICAAFASGSAPTSFLDRTLKYFERRLSQYITSKVPNILALERLSRKKFTFADKVENFILGKDAQRRSAAQVSIWAKIYYCLMCGEGEAAVETAEGNGVAAAIRAFVRGGAGKTRRACVEINKKLQSEDVYYTAVFALITGDLKCISTLNGLHFFKSADDMIHYVLLMIKGGESKTINKTLDELYKSMDPTKFSPYIVFRYYIQLQKFEEALEFLWGSGDVHMKIDALHFGIAMTTSGASFSDTDKLYTLKSVTLPHMTERYTAEFCLPDKEMATLYLTTGASATQDKFSILFDASANYSDTIKVLNAHSSSSNSENVICPHPGNSAKELMDVARSFERDGKHMKAAYLYHSIGAEAEVARIVRSLLGGGIAQGPSASPERTALLKFAGPFAEKTVDRTLTTLVKIATFFDAYNDTNWVAALTILESLDLLPVTPESNCEECARRVMAAEPPEVQRYIPALMEAAMRCFKESWSKLQRMGSSSKNVATPAATAEISEKARVFTQKASAIVTFSALLSIVVPPETCAFIVKVQAEMS